MTEENKRRPVWIRAAFRVLLVGVVFAGWVLFVYSPSPLPDGWNPFKPLNVQDAQTPLTAWKLRRALGDDAQCLAALDTGAQAASLPDFEETEQCHIRPQVRVSAVGDAAMAPLNTRCQTALRLAMWERHGLQPAAARHFDGQVIRITHFSSYNCRQMRTTRSGAPRMSTHATADAIDISGFNLRIAGQTRSLSLLKNWNGTAAEQAFFRAVRDSACNWFRVTLGPDYNRLHADHFHLQHTGWGLCK